MFTSLVAPAFGFKRPINRAPTWRSKRNEMHHPYFFSRGEQKRGELYSFIAAATKHTEAKCRIGTGESKLYGNFLDQ